MEQNAEADHTLLAALIDLGESGERSAAWESTLEECSLRRILAISSGADQIADAMTLDSLEHLIRGLVLYSHGGRDTGGSVSPVIRLFALFRARATTERTDVLSRWIVEHRRNDYEPYGSAMYGGASTADEFDRQRTERRTRSERNAALERTRQADARSLKAQVQADTRSVEPQMRADLATGQLRNAVARGDVLAVEALLTARADWQRVVSMHGPLRRVAEKHGHERVLRLLERYAIP